jgi:hypothetical protein
LDVFPGPPSLVLVLLLLSASAQAEKVALTGVVVDERDQPVAGVSLGGFWNAERGTMRPFSPTTTDTEGRFNVTVDHYGAGVALMAMDEPQARGAIHVLRTNRVDGPIRLVLGPLVTVRGEFTCQELGEAPSWSNVYLSVQPGRIRLLQDMADPPRFAFKVPPGTYEFWGYSSEEFRSVRRELTITNGQPVLDLGQVDLAASPLGRSYGKSPPPWHVTAARGVSTNVQVADYRGRWLLVEFWGFW